MQLYIRKSLKKLIVNDRVISNPKDILTAQVEFYKNLYAKNPSVHGTHENIQDFLQGCTVPKLDQYLRESCEGEILEEECDEVIRTFKNNKSPGP